MYNEKQIQPFFDKVHEEASAAAQVVYDKYSEELKQRLKNQLHKNHELCSINGECWAAYVKTGNRVPENLDNFFFACVADNTQYNKVEAGFDVSGTIINK